MGRRPERVRRVAETVGAVLVLLLAMYGCVQGIRWVVMRLLWPAKSPGVWVLPLSGHCEEVEYHLRRVAAGRRWNALPGGEVYLLDMGADEETAALARRLCGAVRGVQMVDADELATIFLKNSLQEEHRLV